MCVVLTDDCDRELTEKLFNLQRYSMLCVSNQLTELPCATVLLRLGAGWGGAANSAAVFETLMSLFLVVTLGKQKSKLWNQQRKLKAVYLAQVDALLMFASYVLWHLLGQQS